ncbi:MAG: L-aspartate oxidase [Planctomycetota bacterium]|nr:L-aspartate oxidase [Planctomycetota bacterium]
MTEAHPLLSRRYLATFRTSRIPHRFADLLVVGSGVAGLTATLAASERPDVEVLLVSKDAIEESATRWAQGGVAAVLRPGATEDSQEKHVADTLAAAAGLADPESVARTVSEGVERVEELLALGVDFDRGPSGELQFTREGGHSRPRILPRGDTTGQEIERVLVERARQRENVHILEHTFALDLLTADGACHGALLSGPGGRLEAAWARTTVLASGGAGRLYRETTNPPVCTGDGMAMAFRAGALLQDLEFVQFHPTTLYLAGAERFLITEAARGEGGVLRDGAGEAFMARYHELKDLAPRDVVSRAILDVIRHRPENTVWLDLTGIGADKIRVRFPRILEYCRDFGIDILKDPIPVRPCAHYSIGGVKTNIDAETSIEGLLAAGEVSCSGAHGANRLGSNSLLEGLVFGRRAGQIAASRVDSVPVPRPFSTADLPGGTPPAVRAPAPGGGDSCREVDLEDLGRSLKSLLWYKVGVERSGDGLRAALQQIESWIPYYLAGQFDSPQSWSLQNMLETAYLVTLSALRREESRGVHYRSDFPHRDDEKWKRHSILSRDTI